MTGITIINMLLIILVLFSKINSQERQIHFVYDYCINGTSDIVDLESVEGNYIYYYYDFYCFNTFSSEKKGTYYFELDSNVGIINHKNILNYVLLDVNLTSYDEIINFEVKDLNYKPINYFRKGKRGDDDYTRFSYYYEIKKDENMNTLIFRIPKNGLKNGSLSMDSLKNLSYVGAFDEEVVNYTDIDTYTDTDTDTDADTDFIIPNINEAFIPKFKYFLLLSLLFI